MLIAEDLLLLLTDDTNGNLSVPAMKVDIALGGATLIELALMNKVDLSPDTDDGPGRIVVPDPSPTGDEVLDAALELAVAHQGKKPSALMKPLSEHLRPTLYNRLAASGVVRSQHGRIVGIFPTHRWPTQDARHEMEVRALVTETLTRQTKPDPRTAALIALLHALDSEHKIVDPHQHHLSKRELRARAEEIANGDWAAETVRKTIDAMLAALAAVVASGAATSAVVLPGAN